MGMKYPKLCPQILISFVLTLPFAKFNWKLEERELEWCNLWNQSLRGREQGQGDREEECLEKKLQGEEVGYRGGVRSRYKGIQSN